jgi:hypothetical protein
VTEISAELLDTGDYVVNRLLERVADMDDAEHQWQPMPGAWTVLPDGVVEHPDQYGRPSDAPPLTTLAWRLWHIGNECLCGFAKVGFGLDPLGLPADRWYPDAAGSIDGVRRAWDGYRGGITEERMHSVLGPKFGPYAEATYAAQVLHVLDEVIHHGAEVGMLRDLYRVRSR